MTIDNGRGENALILDLLLRAKNGDPEAFSALYERHTAPIYRYIYFRVRSREDAEDLTQTVFLKAYGSLSSYEERGLPFAAWLYRIARNLTIDYWKKKRDVLAPKPEELFPELPDNSGDASKSSFDRERASVLERAIKELSPDQKDVIILKCIEDRSYKEIAEVTGKSEEAIRALKHRALKALRVILEKYGYESR